MQDLQLPLWIIYLDVARLQNTTTNLIYEIVARIRPNTYGDRVIIYAVTDSKERLNGFFEIHKREMFIVAKRESAEQEELEHLKRWQIQPTPVECGVLSGDIIRSISPSFYLSPSELDEVGQSLEIVDDVMYNVYQINEKFPLNDKLFSKEIRQALHDLRFKEFLKSASWLYSEGYPSGIEFNARNIRLNEWYLLKQTFGELMIGGDDYKNPYF